MPVMLHFNDSAGRLTAVNDYWLAKLGYEGQQVIGQSAADFFSPQSRHLLASHYGRQIASKGSLENVPLQMVRSDGSYIDVLLGSSVEKDETGGVTAICARMVDITERNMAEAALRKSEARFERAVRGTSDGLWDWDLESGHVWYGPRFKELLGYDADEFADNFTSFKQSLHPDDRGGTLAAISQRLDGESFDIECRLRTKAGPYRWFRVRGLAHLGDDGTPRRMAGSVQDITLEKLSEQALRDNRNFYELILDSVPAQIAYVDATMRVQFINRACAALLGMTKKGAIGHRLDELIPHDNYAAMDAALMGVLERQPQHLHMKWPLDNGIARLEIDFLPHKTIEGRVLGFFWLARDVTTQHQLEAELRQAQKMEAVGQLTGGIAHDFNNLLSVILGNLQLLERRVGHNESLATKVATAKRAALRGAELTRRLLAFARQQVLEPEVVALDGLVAGMQELLTRTLGQYIDVAIESDAELWSIEADPGQVENCLLNLAINARDAMGDGGGLFIETRNTVLGGSRLPDNITAQPGDYVMLSVKDNGSGIPADLLDQVAEPFFTTKEVGKGTGLGLSMVFGFVRQSGGHAQITSEPGKGTQVKLYFPRCQRTVALKNSDPQASEAAALPRGEETVLVVEDDADVRETAVAMLADLGYRIIAADSPAQAIEILESNQVVDLLFSDVMMPGMRGTQLTARARESRPALKVLYTTGFTATGILQQEVLAPGADLIGKPYRAEDLATMVRHALDGEGCDA
jgi:PAS domain S-box-containing protein